MAHDSFPGFTGFLQAFAKKRPDSGNEGDDKTVLFLFLFLVFVLFFIFSVAIVLGISYLVYFVCVGASYLVSSIEKFLVGIKSGYFTWLGQDLILGWQVLQRKKITPQAAELLIKCLSNIDRGEPDSSTNDQRVSPVKRWWWEWPGTHEARVVRFPFLQVYRPPHAS